MNGNGTYRLERKRWWSWWPLTKYRTSYAWRTTNLYDGREVAEFKTNADACNMLVKMQERADTKAREEHWTTVAEIKE